MVNQSIVEAYSSPQVGGDLPFFVGKQYGRGWLRTIARMAFPILRRIGRVAVKTAQDVIEDEKEVMPSLVANTVRELTTTGKRKSTTPYARKNSKRVRYGNGIDYL